MTKESIKRNFEVYKPEMGMTAGLIFMGFAVVRAFKDAEKIKETKKQVANETKPKKAIAMAKVYAPTVGCYLLGSMFIMNSYNTLAKRATALGLAYSMTDTAFKEYADKVTEMVGEKKAKEVTNAIAKDAVDAKPYSEDKITAGNGPTIVLDLPSGRYFKSDMQTIRAAENDMNSDMINGKMNRSGDGRTVWNDFYDKMGWPEISVGDILGWHVAFEGFKIDYESVLTDDGTPILVIDYRPMPLTDYEGY